MSVECLNSMVSDVFSCGKSSSETKYATLVERTFCLSCPSMRTLVRPWTRPRVQQKFVTSQENLMVVLRCRLRFFVENHKKSVEKTVRGARVKLTIF